MKRSGIMVGIVVGLVVAAWGGWAYGQQKQSDEFTSMDYAEILHLYSKYVQAIDGIWMDGKGEHYADTFTEGRHHAGRAEERGDAARRTGETDPDGGAAGAVKVSSHRP